MTWLNDGNPIDGTPEPPAQPVHSAVASVAPTVAPIGVAPKSNVWPLVVASLWAVAAAGIGLYFVFGINAEVYGGDAYTGIESAIVTAVKAIGWLIVGSGVLGIVVAGSRSTK